MTVKTLTPHRTKRLTLCAVVLATLSLCQITAVRAQVMEIGSGGAVTLYDGPAVVTSTGVTSIGRPASASRSSLRLKASPPSPARLSDAIADAARGANLSASLIAAIAWRESNFRASAVSRAGALGEMQLLPETARQLGVDPRVSRENIAGGAAYIRALLQRYDGDLIKTLAAYNAGPRAVDRYGGVPPFKETQAYVAAVLERLSQESLANERMSQDGAHTREILPSGADPRVVDNSVSIREPIDVMVISGSGR